MKYGQDDDGSHVKANSQAEAAPTRAASRIAVCEVRMNMLNILKIRARCV